MTAENMAEHRGDPNMSFWRTLKEGYDGFESDEASAKVSVCSSRYVFNKEFEGSEPSDPLAACPPVARELEPMALAKINAENRRLDVAMTEALPTSSTMTLIRTAACTRVSAHF